MLFNCSLFVRLMIWIEFLSVEINGMKRTDRAVMDLGVLFHFRRGGKGEIAATALTFERPIFTCRIWIKTSYFLYFFLCVLLRKTVIYWCPETWKVEKYTDKFTHLHRGDEPCGSLEYTARYRRSCTPGSYTYAVSPLSLPLEETEKRISAFENIHSRETVIEVLIFWCGNTKCNNMIKMKTKSHCMYCTPLYAERKNCCNN